MKKEAVIKKLDGIVISDPSYNKDVWCRYESNIKDTNWNMVFNSKKEKDNEYGFESIDFNLSIGNPKVLDKIEIENDSISYPASLKVKEFEIGMDTACFCCGSMKNYKLLEESMSISTGTDGMMGSVYEFKFPGQDNPVAIVFQGEIDADFISEEELFKSFCSGFDANEINKNLDEIVYDAANKKKEISYQKEDLVDHLVHVGFGRKSDVKATVWNYANKLMIELEKQGVVKAHDFGRGKGKWKICDDNKTIADIVKYAKEHETPAMEKITFNYLKYERKQNQNNRDI